MKKHIVYITEEQFKHIQTQLNELVVPYDENLKDNLPNLKSQDPNLQVRIGGENKVGNKQSFVIDASKQPSEMNKDIQNALKLPGSADIRVGVNQNTTSTQIDQAVNQLKAAGGVVNESIKLSKKQIKEARKNYLAQNTETYAKKDIYKRRKSE